MHTTIIKKE